LNNNNKKSNPSFELGPGPQTRVQNSGQALAAKPEISLTGFRSLFFLFTKKKSAAALMKFSP
jgi:hypothetical protein